MKKSQSFFPSHVELSAPDEEENDIIVQDTFAMMMISGVKSRSWILGSVSFCFQMILASLLVVDQFKVSEGSSLFDVPFKVDWSMVYYRMSVPLSFPMPFYPE